jgi:hypothetical protein
LPSPATSMLPPVAKVMLLPVAIGTSLVPVNREPAALDVR